MQGPSTFVLFLLWKALRRGLFKCKDPFTALNVNSLERLYHTDLIRHRLKLKFVMKFRYFIVDNKFAALIHLCIGANFWIIYSRLRLIGSLWVPGCFEPIKWRTQLTENSLLKLARRWAKKNWSYRRNTIHTRPGGAPPQVSNIGAYIFKHNFRKMEIIPTLFESLFSLPHFNGS